jgi:hypothetical protein
MAKHQWDGLLRRCDEEPQYQTRSGTELDRLLMGYTGVAAPRSQPATVRPATVGIVGIATSLVILPVFPRRVSVIRYHRGLQFQQLCKITALAHTQALACMPACVCRPVQPAFLNLQVFGPEDQPLSPRACRVCPGTFFLLSAATLGLPRCVELRRHQWLARDGRTALAAGSCAARCRT